jgi:membrane protein YdbS with pleckstrin-like domain
MAQKREWSASPAHRRYSAWYILWLLPVVGAATLIYALDISKIYFAILGVIGSIGLLKTYLEIRSTRYSISPIRIEHEIGILKKTRDVIDMRHVKDVRLERGVVDYLLRVGTVTVTSRDQSHPELKLLTSADPGGW